MKKAYKHIDLTHLRQFSNENKKFIREIILISVEQTAGEIDNLRGSLETKNYKRIGPICHKMRSSMGFMGINPEVIEQLKEVEALAVDKAEELEKYTRQIIEACVLINADLMQVLQQDLNGY